MIVELNRIAESKIRQLGGDVCGVLVRTQDSEVMAVSEHGRCTRLDAGVMGPVEPAGMSERELFEQKFPVPEGIYWNDVSEQYDALPGVAGFDDVEIYHGQWMGWQAARAQSGQGAEPDWSASKTLESEGWKNPLLSKNDRLQIADGAVAWRDEVIKNLRSRAPQQGSVPEGWKLVPEFMTLDYHGREMIKVMTGDGEAEEDFTECVLWVGGIHGDDGERESYGLNIACAECLQEGSVTAVPFDAPQPPKQEGSGDEH